MVGIMFGIQDAFATKPILEDSALNSRSRSRRRGELGKDENELTEPVVYLMNRGVEALISFRTKVLLATLHPFVFRY